MGADWCQHPPGVIGVAGWDDLRESARADHLTWPGRATEGEGQPFSSQDTESGQSVRYRRIPDALELRNGAFLAQLRQAWSGVIDRG